MMLNRSKWTIDDANAVAYLLDHRLDALDFFEREMLDTLKKKRALKDTISVKQRIFFDDLWERKAPGKRVVPAP